MKGISILCLILLVLKAYSQVIPDSRQADWSDATFSYETASPVPEVNVMDYGAAGNGTANDQPAVMSAIAALNGHGGYVYFPPGTYKLTAPVVLPDSTILKGATSDSTVLQFNFATSPYDCIVMSGSGDTLLIQLNGGYSKGSHYVITDSAFLFNSAGYAEILETNGSWDVVPATWAANSVGQIVQVDHVNGDTIYLESPLRITYQASLDPRIRRVYPRFNAGVECLKIKRMDQADAGANIIMNYAAYCFVRGVESDVSVSAHVDIFTSTRILVEGCYFHHAFLYDGASKHGYGVTLNSHSGECLITNNIFRYLRHAMMVKTGANGNVFSYNYSREVHRTESPSDLSGDISLHGHYAYANLFEGNIVQNIMADLAWGPSGPYNTFFRNRAELYGIIFSAGSPATDSQNIVGNDITYALGSYTITGYGHLQHGNNNKGTIIPAGTGTLNDISYYITGEPVFWSISDTWPSLGIPNPLGSGSNPARSRWFQGGTMTVCPLRRSWAGTSSAWNDPHNWLPYGTPNEATEVKVPPSASNDLQISDGMVHKIRSIRIGAGSELRLMNGSELKVLK